MCRPKTVRGQKLQFTLRSNFPLEHHPPALVLTRRHPVAIGSILIGIPGKPQGKVPVLPYPGGRPDRIGQVSLHAQSSRITFSRPRVAGRTGSPRPVILKIKDRHTVSPLAVEVLRACSVVFWFQQQGTIGNRDDRRELLLCPRDFSYVTPW